MSDMDWPVSGSNARWAIIQKNEEIAKKDARIAELEGMLKSLADLVAKSCKE